MLIRKETATDYEAVYAIVKLAFENDEHADGNEQDMVNALRKGDAFIPELSLVAEADGKVVGHIMFTRASVDGKPVLALAPLSVLPEYQRKGIGKAPFDVPSENFMVWMLDKTGIEIHGTIKYAPEFGIE